MSARRAVDAYPLTPLQQGILFHCLNEADQPLYVTDFACRLADLDGRRFADAWQWALDRHPVLRTAFAWEGMERPLQVVGGEVRLPLVEEDWRHLSGAEQRARFEAYCATEGRRPFKLTRAPLLSLALFRIDEASHYLLFRHHHLILDGWSLALLMGEVFRRHGAGDGSPPPAEPPPYRAYVEWLEGQDLRLAESYWRRLLAGFTSPTPLGVGVAGGTPARVAAASRALGATTTAALGAAARRHRLTLNTVAQGAWAFLLGRYSGGGDVVYGATVSGRPPELPAAESMLGVFINTLPVRARLPAGGRVMGWLAGLQRNLAEMRRFEHTPLVAVQRWSEVDRERPLFESLLVFENYLGAEAMAGELSRFGLSEASSRLATNYPLLIKVQPGRELTLVATYDCDRFSAAEIARLLHHLAALLAQLAAAPELQPAAWSPLRPAERHQLLAEWNDTAAPCPPPGLLHAPIARQVALRPEAVAVTAAGSDILTYRALHARARRLGRRLRSLGVAPEAVAAVALERSTELMVALLAVLEAGGAYLPLDLSYPAERLRFMLADAAAPVLLCRGAVPLAAPPATAVVDLAGDGEEGGGEDGGGETDSGEAAPAPGDLAYVLYTSGSTGRPKGVMCPHGAIDNRLRWMQAAYRLGAGDRVLQKTPLSFDVSLWELFWPLREGASLVLLEPGAHRDARRLVQAVAEEAVTTLHFVPSMLAPFLAEEGLEACHLLRRVISSGEALAPELVRSFRRRLAAVELDNLYGPTEAAVDVTAWACRPAGEPVAIGRPITNLRLMVLDRRLRPTPMGLPGQLHIAGVGLARGYLGRPALTAERFLPDPFAGAAGGRLYATGDLGRTLPGGELQFLGRVDAQVKVRGFRIEPGEVEAALLEHPRVREAAVAAPGSAAGGRRLVAYAAPGDALAAGELRRFLAQRLPEHMVPAAIVLLDALPRTPSGKLDRRRLPEPEGDRSGVEGAFVAPRTAAEELLAGLWAQALGVDRVGVHDPFLDLGGDSILALQIAGKARRAGLDITPRQVFEHRTVAALAAAAAVHRPPAEDSGPVTGPVPLTPIQHWFFERPPAVPHHFNQSLLLQAVEELDAGLLAAAWEALVTHHDALRLRFDRDDGGWRQVNAAPGGPPSFALVDLERVAGDGPGPAVERLAAAAQGSLDLARGPLARALLLRPGGGQPERLLLLAHHLVVDGVSWRILLEDLHAAYRDLAAGERVALPPRTTSYQAWSQGLVEQVRRGAFDGELPRWCAAASARTTALPVDLTAGEETVATARALSVRLDPEATRELVREVPAAYQTGVDDALLTALAQALGEWTGRRAVVVEVESHGREELAAGWDLSRTVGWFTALYPVHLDLTDSRDPGEALKRVKEQLRRVPRLGVGYGALRYLGDGETARRLAALPRAQVLYNYLGQLDQALPAASLVRPAPEAAAPDVHPRTRRSHLLEVDARLAGGQLEVRWRYSESCHRRRTVAALAASFLRALEALIAHCKAPRAGGYTPSDFPGLELDQGELDDLMADLTQEAER